jgi:sortase A
MTAEAPPDTNSEPGTTSGIAVVTEPAAASSRDRWAVPRRVVRKLGPPPRTRPPNPRRWLLVWAAACLSLLGLWLLFYALVLSSVQQGRSQAVLYAELRQGLAEATTPFGGPIEPGTAVMLVDAPTAGLHSVVVVEGTTSGDLEDGPGHLASTVFPGQAGTSVLFGRSVTYGAPFATIGHLRAGDHIVVTTGQGQFTYAVDRVRHPGDPLPQPLAANTSRLTLVSTTGSGWRTGWAPQQTVYVDATMQPGTDPTTKIQPAPSGRPTSVPDAARPMQGDLNALLPLVLWLQFLIIVAVFAAWGRARWGTWQTWLIAVPLVLAGLWGATQAGFQLLPNLV